MNHVQAPVRHPPQPPPSFAALADPTSVVQTSDELCKKSRQVVDKLVTTVTAANATFDNVLRPLLQHENAMQLTSNLITMISLVAPDAALRNAAAEASDKVSHCMIDCKAGNTDLFRLLDAVHQRQKDEYMLDSESRKALVEERRSYVRKGMGLVDRPLAGDAGGSRSAAPDCTTAVRDIARRLQSIQSEFMKNLDGRPHFIWLTRDELAGVSEDALSGFETGTGELDGKLGLDLNGMQARWILTVASSPAARQKIYLGTKRAVSQDTSTVSPPREPDGPLWGDPL